MNEIKEEKKNVQLICELNEKSLLNESILNLFLFSTLHVFFFFFPIVAVSPIRATVFDFKKSDKPEQS